MTDAGKHKDGRHGTEYARVCGRLKKRDHDDRQRGVFCKVSVAPAGTDQSGVAISVAKGRPGLHALANGIDRRNEQQECADRRGNCCNR